MVTITDDFESLADGDPLSDDTDWDVDLDGRAGVPTMDQHDDHSDGSQVVDMSTRGNAHCIHQTQIGSDDMDVELDVFLDTEDNAANHLGPVVRGSASAWGVTFDGYAALVYGIDNAVAQQLIFGIFRIDNGVYTELSNTGDLGNNGTGDYLASTQHTLRLKIEGSTLTLYVDGNQELTDTDTTYTTGQYVGFRMERDVSAALSQPFVDNFSAVDISTGQTITLGRATETDVARGVTVQQDQSLTLGQATETDAATGLAGIVNPRTYQLGRATETDVARSVSVGLAQTIQLGRATSTAVARGLTVVNPRTYEVARAVESDTARSVSIVTPAGQTIALGRATETDVARGPTIQQDQSVTLGRATETDVARGIVDIGLAQTIALGRATETDLAVGIALIIQAQFITLGRATEVDVARQLSILGGGEHTSAAAVNTAIIRAAGRIHRVPEARRTYRVGEAGRIEHVGGTT